MRSTRASAPISEPTRRHGARRSASTSTPHAAPTPLPSYPGVLRWTPTEGADGYEVWLIDIGKIEYVRTNVLDEREFYTFHQSAQWISTVRWRVRAVRGDQFKQRLNGIAGRADRSVEPRSTARRTRRSPTGTDPVDRNCLGRLLDRNDELAGPRDDAGLLVEGQPDDVWRDGRPLPRRGLHRQAVLEPRVHGRGRRKPCLGAAPRWDARTAARTAPA